MQSWCKLGTASPAPSGGLRHDDRPAPVCLLPPALQVNRGLGRGAGTALAVIMYAYLLLSCTGEEPGGNVAR